jgi:hypothetical protein
VAKDAAVHHLRYVAAQDVQIGATDRDSIDAHDCVGRFLDDRIGHLFPGSLARAVINECLHDVGPFVWSAEAGLGPCAGTRISGKPWLFARTW